MSTEIIELLRSLDWSDDLIDKFFESADTSAVDISDGPDYEYFAQTYETSEFVFTVRESEDSSDVYVIGD